LYVAEVNDPEFVKDIDINDQQNQYLLTKGPTQAEVIGSTLLQVDVHLD
jgi:hypothetical protein